jgi:hypothetical protein
MDFATMRASTACGLAILTVWLCPAVLALAEDFRIQTRVYRGEEEAPVSQNLTLFRGGVVYDFLSEPAETTIYDRPRGNKSGRFVLLSPERQVQTEVTLEKLARFMSNLQLSVASQSDPFLRFLAQPEFKEDLDPKQQTWTYTSRWMNYRLKTTPAPNEELFHQYDDFSELFVRLNTMLTIKTRPPYGLGRLAVNASLRARREIPTEVTLIVDSPSRLLRRPVSFRSEHQLTQMLSQSDQARITETETQLVNFKRIDLEEYLQPAVEK